MATEKKRHAGTYVQCSVGAENPYQAYIPNDLPLDPPLNMNSLSLLLDKANTAVGRMDGISTLLPDPFLFIYMYVRREAVLSSQIEGTQSSLSDLLQSENIETAGRTSPDDIKEVSCYVSALGHGIERLKDLPLSLRLIREMHEKLMDNARGYNKQPGEFRKTQNWIGGNCPDNAVFVPPPPDKLIECLTAFESFLHNDKLSPLVKIALAHAQFETIHPFIDGNGRLGRLLIAMMLQTEGILKHPLLYLSLYFKTHRQAYYDHLQSVRKTGDWESWVKFFLIGVGDTAKQATETAQRILKLFDDDHKRIEASGKSTKSILTIYTHLKNNPFANTTTIRKETGLSQQTALRSLSALEELNIMKETTGKSRHKQFVYKNYLDILVEGTEPLK